MPFERLTYLNFEVRMFLFFGRNKLGQIAPQMNSHGKEVGDNDQAAEASLDRLSNGHVQIGLSQLQKSRAHVAIRAYLLDLASQGSHASVGLLNATSVGE